MTDIVVGMLVGDRPTQIKRLAGCRLHYSGGRGTIETQDATALRAFLRGLEGPFLIERGRVGLDTCRLDIPERPARRGLWSRMSQPMKAARVPSHHVAFSYAHTYDTADVETLLPPASLPARDEVRQHAAGHLGQVRDVVGLFSA